MQKEYDIVVIGSGVIGSSISYHLSKQTHKSILTIDKGFPLGGTSGSTQAWVWVHNKTPGYYGELSLYSAELYPYLQKEIGDVEYKRTGGIMPFFVKSDIEKAHALAESQAKVGIPIKVLTREEALAKEPALSNDIEGATYSPIDGNVNPFRLVELYIRAAKKNGAEFSFYNEVTEIEKKNDFYFIHTKKGLVKANKVVISSGPWTKYVGSLFDIHIPVKQVRGQILITEPLEPFLNHTIGGIRQANNGEVLMGYSKEEVGYDRRTTLDVIQETANVAVKMVPSLQKANIVRSFAGVRVIPEDDLPILGNVPGNKNLYLAVMHSGVTLSPIVGTLLSELILQGDTSIPIDPYCLTRFGSK